MIVQAIYRSAVRPVLIAALSGSLMILGVADLHAAGEAVRIPDPASVGRLQRSKVADVRRRVTETILTQPGIDASLEAAVAALWNVPDAAVDDLLDRVARTAALVDDRAARLVSLCSGPTDPWLIPDQPWLNDPQEPEWLRNQLRLYFGRSLAQRKMYDRALAVLAGLEPTEVVDPASLLFYQAAAYHHQLQKAPGLRALDRLLDETADCPPRFKVVAGMMREDLKKLEDESLDHIARRMSDIQRRLDFGNADQRTRRLEDDVVRSLDKMIDELEKQRQQQEGSGGGPSGAPMQDSRIARQKGPGETDPKDIGKKSEWGDLPPETREQMKQQLGRDLPAHYYDLIQQYFNNQQGAR